MERIANASQFNWKSNTQGRWTAVVDDIAPSTQDISFGNGYAATVTNRKITVENPTRPSGTVTYAVEDVANTAYAGNLAAVGSVKDTLDVVTGERNTKLGVMTLNGTENWSWQASNNMVYMTYTALGVSAWPSRSGGITAICGVLPCVSRSALDNDISAFSMGDTTGSNQSNIDIRIEGKSSLADVKAWLAENPLTIYYELAEPTSSEEILQPLSLSAGANTASMTDTSTGDKPVFPMSYDGTDYIIAAKSSRVYLKDVDGTVERVTGVTSIPVRGGRDNVMDLTRMFGAGLEPGTLDAFYSLFPAWRGHRLPYNKGSLLNFKGTGLKSVGFNLLDLAGRTPGAPQNTAASKTTVRGPFDETKYYRGLANDNNFYPSSVASLEVTASSITTRSTNAAEYGVAIPIRVIPGMTYRLENYISLCTRMSWYTYNGTWISSTATQAGEAPSNAYWGMILFAANTANTTVTWTDPCVHLQWSGTRNGDYEPYWDYVRPIPTLTYFPDGMNGRGQVYDEINPRQAIRRFGKVDLGTLTWNHIDGGTYGYWESNGIASSIMKPADHSTVAPMVSSLYVAASSNDVSSGTDASLDCIGVRATSGNIRVNNGSTTESPTGWLVYELATPVVTTFPEEISATARISDYGTEECLPVNGYDPVTTPFRGMVLYQDDYARTITKLPENYISKESFEAFLELAGQVANGVYGMTYNPSTGQYAFTYTPNA